MGAVQGTESTSNNGAMYDTVALEDEDYPLNIVPEPKTRPEGDPANNRQVMSIEVLPDVEYRLRRDRAYQIRTNDYPVMDMQLSKGHIDRANWTWLKPIQEHDFHGIYLFVRLDDYEQDFYGAVEFLERLTEQLKALDRLDRTPVIVYLITSAEFEKNASSPAFWKPEDHNAIAARRLSSVDKETAFDTVASRFEKFLLSKDSRIYCAEEATKLDWIKAGLGHLDSAKYHRSMMESGLIGD